MRLRRPSTLSKNSVNPQNSSRRYLHVVWQTHRLPIEAFGVAAPSEGPGLSNRCRDVAAGVSELLPRVLVAGVRIYIISSVVSMGAVTDANNTAKKSTQE